MFRRLLACVMSLCLVTGGAAPAFASTPEAVVVKGEKNKGKAKGTKKGKKGAKKGKGKKKGGKKGGKKGAAKPKKG